MESLACIVEAIWWEKYLVLVMQVNLRKHFKKIVKATVTYNLELTAKDDDGKDIYAGFEVYKRGRCCYCKKVIIHLTMFVNSF